MPPFGWLRVSGHAGHGIEQGHQGVDLLSACQLLGDLDIVAPCLGFGVANGPGHDGTAAMMERPVRQLALQGLDWPGELPALTDTDDLAFLDLSAAKLKDDFRDPGWIQPNQGEFA